MNFLENLKSKPEHTRKRILYVTAPFITLLIFSLWFFSPAQKVVEITDTTKIEEVAPTNIVKGDINSFFDVFSREIKSIFSEITESVGRVQKIFGTNSDVGNYGNSGGNYLMNNFKGNIQYINDFISK